jgi:cytochrome c-type biogenesis protein CcmH
MRILILWAFLGCAAWAQEVESGDELGASEEETEALKALGETPLGAPLEGEEAIRRADEVGSKLRCPQCQGLSVTDSKADAAEAMYKRIHELVEAGYSEEQVLDYFASRYGEGILLEPKAEGMNWLIWAGPGLALALGLTVVSRKSRRVGEAPSQSESEDPDEDAGMARLDQQREVDRDPYLQLILDEVAARAVQ